MQFRLVDIAGKILATGQADESNGLYSGDIDVQDLSQEFRKIFDRFEEIINGQEFSFLDAIEDRISALNIKVQFGVGIPMETCDLQVFPSTNRISFRTRTVPSIPDVVHDAVASSLFTPQSGKPK